MDTVVIILVVLAVLLVLGLAADFVSTRRRTQTARGGSAATAQANAARSDVSQRRPALLVGVRAYLRPDPTAPDRAQVIYQCVAGQSQESANQPSGEAPEDYVPLESAISEAAVKRTLEPLWASISSYWATPVGTGFAGVADSIDAASDKIKGVIIGGPVDLAGQALDLPTPLQVAAVSTARSWPTPADPFFASAKQILQVTGLMVGLAAGHPLFVNACLKSLLHDEAHQIISDTIRSAMPAGPSSVSEAEHINTVEPAAEVEPASGPLPQRRPPLRSRRSDRESWFYPDPPDEQLDQDPSKLFGTARGDESGPDWNHGNQNNA